MNGRTINLLIVLNILVILIATAFVIFSAVRLGPIDFPETEYSEENIEIYFLPSEKAEQQIIDVIDSSEESVHCALRALNYLPLEETLFAKESDGIAVRLFVDNDYAGNKRIYSPFTRFSSDDKGMMHNNYCVVDESIVITGSTVFNENTIGQTIHDTVIITSPELADAYTSNFWMLYEGQEGKTQHVSQIQINNDTFVDVYFCPGDDCEEVLLSTFNAATDRIWFAHYALTHHSIVDALQKLQVNGIFVKGKVDTNGLTPSSIANSDAHLIRVNRFNRVLHTKAFIVDEDVTITGTLNPSLKGITKNDENVLIIHNTEINEVYSSFIDYLFMQEKII